MLDLDAYRQNATDMPQLTFYDRAKRKAVPPKRDPHESSQVAFNAIYVHLVNQIADPLLTFATNTPPSSVELSRVLYRVSKRQKPRVRRTLTAEWSLNDDASIVVKRFSSARLGDQGDDPFSIIKLRSSLGHVTLSRTNGSIRDIPFDRHSGGNEIRMLVSQFEALTKDFEPELLDSFTAEELEAANRDAASKQTGATHRHDPVRFPSLDATEYPDLLPESLLGNAPRYIMVARQEAIDDLRAQVSKTVRAWEVNRVPSQHMAISLKNALYRARLLGDTQTSIIAEQRIHKADAFLKEHVKHLGEFNYRLTTSLANPERSRNATTKAMSDVIANGDRNLGRHHPAVINALYLFAERLNEGNHPRSASKAYREILHRIDEGISLGLSVTSDARTPPQPPRTLVEMKLRATCAQLAPTEAALALSGI